ncbi:MAG: glycine cleavage system protein H [Candidatus Gastranaerophilaceae bacterium]
MNIQDGILCAESHEYVLDCGKYALVGVTNILLEKMGEIFFVEFPEPNSIYSKKEVFATIEADGAAAELYMPVAGKIIEINPALTENYSALNSNPMTDGWLIKIEPLNFQADIDDLMDYNDYIKEN